jgi:hypothetical protein
MLLKNRINLNLNCSVFSGGEFSQIDEKKHIIQSKLNKSCFWEKKKHKSRHIFRGKQEKKVRSRHIWISVFFIGEFSQKINLKNVISTNTKDFSREKWSKFANF